MMHIADSTKEYIVKKNMYSLGNVLTFCGAMAALCTFMMKTYIFYKTNGYLGYFGIRQEIIGIEDEYSLFTFLMLLIDSVLLIIYISIMDTFIGNLIFGVKYEWKHYNKRTRMEYVFIYILCFIFMELLGITISTILFIPTLELDSEMIGMVNIIGGTAFWGLTILLCCGKYLLKVGLKDDENKQTNASIYIKVFDEFVYYLVMIMICFVILIGIAPLMGRELAQKKTSFYITEISGETYAIIYNNDCMLMERCSITEDVLYLYTNEQMISDKNNHILVPHTFDLNDVVCEEGSAMEEDKQ